VLEKCDQKRKTSAPIALNSIFKFQRSKLGAQIHAKTVCVNALYLRPKGQSFTAIYG